MKKSLSIVLSIALVVTTLFGAIVPVSASENIYSTSTLMTFDEQGATFTNSQETFKTGNDVDNDIDDSCDVYTEKTVNGKTDVIAISNTLIQTDSQGDKAAHFGMTINSEKTAAFPDSAGSRPRHPNILKLYDTNKDDMGYFIPAPYTTYKISFDYKVDSIANKDNGAWSWKFRLMYANDIYGNDFDYENDGTSTAVKTQNNVVDSVLTLKSNGATTEWVSTGEITFTTGAYVAPLYIAVVTSPDYWIDANVWVDNVKVAKTNAEDTKTSTKGTVMTYDDAGVTYNNYGSWHATNTDNAEKTYSVRTVNGLDDNYNLTFNDVWVEQVEKEGKTSYAAKIGASRNHGDSVMIANTYTRKPATIKLYDSNKENLGYFIPEPNTTYTISFDYMATEVGAATDKYMKLRLMYANGTDFDYNNDGTEAGYKTELNVIDEMAAIRASTPTNTWMNTGTLSFTTGEKVAPMYIVAITHQTWWYAATVWVDNIVIEKEEIEYSSYTKMTYDDAGVTYTNNGEWRATNTDMAEQTYTDRTINGVKDDYHLTLNGTIVDQVGKDGKTSYAAKIGASRNHGDSVVLANYTRKPGTIKLYDSNKESLGYFIPEPNTTYTISFDYMATEVGAATDKYMKLRLMYANGLDFDYNNDGTDAGYKTELNVIDEMAAIRASTPTNTWMNTGTLTFTTGDKVAPLYIVAITQTTWWYYATVWVDNIEVSKLYTIDKNYRSTNSTMTFDEENVEYENNGEWSTVNTDNAASINTVRKVNGIPDSQPIAQYATQIGIIENDDGDETYAAHLGYARNQEDAQFTPAGNYQRFPNTLKLYDSNLVNLGYFTPQPYTTYTIKFDYMVEEFYDTSGKSLKLRLMYANDAQGSDFSYDGDGTEDGYKRKNNVIDCMVEIDAAFADENAYAWMSTGEIEFTTGEYVAPLYIAMVSSPNWWCNGSLWIDNIEINKVTDGTFMTFDEDNASYSTSGTVTTTTVGNAETVRTVDDNEEDTPIAFNNTAIELTTDNDGDSTFATHFGKTNNLETDNNNRLPNTLKLYKSSKDDLGYFVPKANSSYTINFDYRVDELSSDVVFKLMFANDVAGENFIYDDDDTDDVFKTRAVILNRIVTVTADTAKGEWLNSGTITFTTGDYAAPLYIAMLSTGESVSDADIWIDNIDIKQIYHIEEFDTDEYFGVEVAESKSVNINGEITILPQINVEDYKLSVVLNNQSVSSNAIVGIANNISQTTANIFEVKPSDATTSIYKRTADGNEFTKSYKFGLDELRTQIVDKFSGNGTIANGDEFVLTIYHIDGVSYFYLNDEFAGSIEDIDDTYGSVGIYTQNANVTVSSYTVEKLYLANMISELVYGDKTIISEDFKNSQVGTLTEGWEVANDAEWIWNPNSGDAVVVEENGVKGLKVSSSAGTTAVILPEISSEDYILTANIKLLSEGNYGILTNVVRNVGATHFIGSDSSDVNACFSINNRKGQVQSNVKTVPVVNTVGAFPAVGETVELRVYHFDGSSYFFVDGVYIAAISDALDSENVLAGLYSYDSDYIVTNITVSEASLAKNLEAVDVTTAVRFANIAGEAISGGMRFTSNVNITSSIFSDSESVIYGLVFGKKSAIGNYPLTISSANAANVVSNDVKINGDIATYSETLMNMSIADMDDTYTVRAYIGIVDAFGKVNYYYSEAEDVVAAKLANRYYNKGNATDEQKALMEELFATSDYFYGSTDETRFTVFADLHYKEGMYLSSVADVNDIMAAASVNNSDFVMQLGDFCNDYLGSPEITNAYLNNTQGLKAYGIYGNHELESNGNSMQVVTPLLTNDMNVIWGTEDGKIGDGSIGYYWYKSGAYRVICLDNNYSYNSARGIWEHNYTGSYGSPAGNSKSASLGPVQLAWLEELLIDSANEGISCIINAHGSFNTEFASDTPDAVAIEELYTRVNNINPGTVVMSLNGHYHSDHIQLRQLGASNVLFLNVNTVRNGLWKAEATDHYTNSGSTFNYVKYDANGNAISNNPNASVAELSMAQNTYFFDTPLYTNVTISKDGKIVVDTVKTGWYDGVEPSAELIAQIDPYINTQITGGICNYLELGSEIKTNAESDSSFSP